MTSKIRNGVFALFLAAIGLGLFSYPSGLSAQENEQSTNKAIQIVLEHKLRMQHILENDNVQVTVSNNTITLNGTVGTLEQKQQAEKDAHQVEESYKIVDNLVVKNPNATNQQVADNVIKEFQKHIFYSIFDWVVVEADSGNVTLKGWVYVPWHKPEFGQEAAKAAGVKKVINDITVLPISSTDDQIRAQAARLIYNDPAFENYADNTSPPIHIIVDNGRVILEGVVTSEFARGHAADLVQFGTDAISVNNQLVVAQ
jgi:hyperosmotically inducible periplasmic protein